MHGGTIGRIEEHGNGRVERVVLLARMDTLERQIGRYAAFWRCFFTKKRVNVSESSLIDLLMNVDTPSTGCVLESSQPQAP